MSTSRWLEVAHGQLSSSLRSSQRGGAAPVPMSAITWSRPPTDRRRAVAGVRFALKELTKSSSASRALMSAALGQNSPCDGLPSGRNASKADTRNRWPSVGPA